LLIEQIESVMIGPWSFTGPNLAFSKPKPLAPSITPNDMPIFRNTSNRKTSGQNESFHDSVSGVPMAMSMMIDSMVNMVHINQPHPSATSATIDAHLNEY
jgi:hypothetical protein